MVVKHLNTIDFRLIYGTARACHKQDGIRGSKDLRAEIGKFPNSTNERKKMSIKTIRKRIAVVAVSALTAGVFSVSSAPLANAANLTATISLIPSITGAASASTTDADSRQVGWVAATNSAATLTADLMTLDGGDAQTGVCLSTCSLPWKFDRTSDTAGYGVVVTGGTFSSIADSITLTNGSGVLTVNGSRNAVTLAPGATDSSLRGLVTASSSATTMTVSFYQGSSITDIDNVSNGALVGSLTITIAATGVAGAFSASKSSIYTQIPYAVTETASGLLGYDDTTRINNGQRGSIYVSLKDAYSTAITTGTITATATNGSLVSILDTIPAAGMAFGPSSAFASDANGLTGGDAYITVTQPVAGVAGSTTVTIARNGETLATKTLNWSGEITKVELIAASSNTIFKNGGGDADGALGIVYKVSDAAGNAVTMTAHPTITGQTGAFVGASLSGTSNVAVRNLQTSSVGYGNGTLIVPASSLQGAGTFKLRVVNGAGANVDSAEIKGTVANGATNSFTASWDKASYAPGDLATLTITIKDAYGNLMEDGKALTGLVLSVASGFTSVGGLCEATTKVTTGVKKCVYAAGNTDGSYSFSVDMDTATDQAAAVGALKIAGPAVVSNADVLKSIVALIASINKQIQALQKLILKK